MSNHLAIATVTGTLQRVISKAVEIVPGAAVDMTRPDGAAAAPGPKIHIFLYQVTPNAAYRNADLPTRRANGEVVQRPQAALVLHYLLSFVGKEVELQPQRLLGAVVRHFHARPLLTREDITKTCSTGPLSGVLGPSNLAEQVDAVRVTPLNLSLEELSKVWSIFFQTPYLLSVAYQASAVLIESDDAPRPALPVASRNVYVVPFRQPVVDRVVSAAGDQEPIVSTSTLRIVGTRFRADATFVLLDGLEHPAADVSDAEVQLKVPAGLLAGVHALQILQKQRMGAVPGTFHRGFESNVATFVLRPQAVISKVVEDGGPALSLKFDLAVGETQRVVLTLHSTSGAQPKIHSFADAIRKPDPTVIVFKIPDVDPGTYFVIAQVDGAASPLDLEPSSSRFGPTVTLP